MSHVNVTQCYEAERHSCLLKDNAQRVLIPCHTLIFNNTRVRQPLNKIDLPHQLGHFFLLQAFKANAFNSKHLATVHVARSINGTKLSTSDTVAQLLSRGSLMNDCMHVQKLCWSLRKESAVSLPP